MLSFWSGPLAGAAIAAGISLAASQLQAPGAAARCDPDNGGITLPPGFCATLFADSLGAARHLVVAPNGDVLVNVRPTRGGSGNPGVYILRDTDRDGRAEIRRRAADAAGTGIALANGYVYATAGTSIVRYPYRVGSLELSGAGDTIVKDMPGGGHDAYNFVVDGARLYVNVGSRTNSCQERDRQTESRGVDPCVELETRAGIWVFSSERPNQTQSSGRRYATGIRNAVAMTLRAGDPNALYVVQHGRDQLAQNWGKLFNERQSAENPAEELFRNDLDKRVLAPEYGGDGRAVGRCSTTKDPLYAFPGHWAPNAILFHTGTAFPAAYRGGAFVAFHGSWNRAPLPQEGFKVVYLPMSGQRVTGAFRVFADGFVSSPPSPNEPTRPSRLGRPTGLAQGPDGALYISDDAGGRVWRITTN
jgi:glucose/arabinose dehydrogenase